MLKECPICYVKCKYNPVYIRNLNKYILKGECKNPKCIGNNL